MKCGEQCRPRSLRNISARGLQLEGEELPPSRHLCLGLRRRPKHPGRRNGLGRDKLAGIEVFEELSWTSIIPWVRRVIRKSGN